MKTKLYSKELDEMVGRPGELVLYKKLVENLFEVRYKPEGEYGPDFQITTFEDKYYYADCEVRKNWSSAFDEFPFKSVHVPARKHKFLNMKYPLLYFVLREDLKRGLQISGEVIQNSPVVTQKNKYQPQGDDFFDVPREDVSGYFDV